MAPKTTARNPQTAPDKALGKAPAKTLAKTQGDSPAAPKRGGSPQTGSARTGAAQPGSARAWQRMLSGRRLDLLDPSPLDVEIEDIAHGLSRVARWNGQTSGDYPFSVAQHSLLVEALAGHQRKNAPKRWLLAALLHDAPEYVVGDLISPFKAAVGIDYKALELRLMQAVLLRFGLPGALPQDVTEWIKRADIAAAYLEATRLAGFAEAEARRYFGNPRALAKLDLSELLLPRPPEEVKARFLARFRALEPYARLETVARGGQAPLVPKGSKG